eukprot:CAMPEP_0203685138 /NCGR_PEP_ID=MMETSP0090-20130426/48393_1 /ASSEMBLY_ACC=CAM_ASM_001088 /TAXON_ID=426623 /ORGANISM="Chaetoceros affinis, Strain CCMP159" /LENGTH=965 /DNA_ID=CAMNT_0050554323 /DNA_START=51 /DNA_END=2948 /DNA_ORIENTATION=+
MTVVSRTVSTSHPEATSALKVLSALVGLTESSITFAPTKAASAGDDDTFSVEMKVTAHNSFSATDMSYTAHGLLGCARAICKAVPEVGLWGQLSQDDSGSALDSLIESWIETAASTLVFPAYVASDSRVKEAHFQEEVGKFAASIEKHLFDSSKTFLVGDTATAADVVVAILLVDAAARCEMDKIPLQVVRLLETILANTIVQSVVGKKDIPQVGTVTPMVKPAPETKTQEAPAAETETPAPAAVEGSDDFSTNVIVQKLDELGISHKTYSHKLSTKVEELLENVPLPDGETHTKNVFLKDKKHGLFLVSVKADSDINTKALGKALKLQGKVNLRLANEEILLSSLGVKTGCVGPMCIMNNTAKDVTLVLDERLFEDEIKKVHSHPLTNDTSTALIPSDLKKFVESVGFEPVMLRFEVKSADVGGKAPASRPEATKEPKGKAKPQPQPAKENVKKGGKKGETLLALQYKKSEDFAMWYSNVITLSEMIAYYDISGCYILRPWSYKMWDLIQNWFNIEIEKLGVENSYFPLFVSKDRLEKEKDHVEGFAPEVAWVTKSGDGDLAKPIAVRPTSETIMYPAFSDWIQSHRDLPLKLNQWSNVVRWEFKYPTPFLRSREFLWQEGHTAHATYDDANVMVMQALELYRRVYEEILAVPVVPGYKTEEEKFAGGHQTTTVEAYIAGSGRAIQGATSHNLGQNFGKMFDITFQDTTGKSQVVWQTSWGLTTRTIGVMVMVHGDDQGLVLPPRIAPLQVVIVPIFTKKFTTVEAKPYCEAIVKDLHDQGIRAKYDDRTMYNPGWKYNHWEQKGVPLRVEVGPRDIESKQARLVTRFNGDKEDASVDGLGSFVKAKLETIQEEMFNKAKAARDEHLVQVTEWKDFVPNLEKNNLVLTPWIGGEHKDWEEWVKEKSREESLKARGQEAEDSRTSTSVAAKTLCIPFTQPELPEGTKCIASGKPATCWVLWGRSY